MVKVIQLLTIRASVFGYQHKHYTTPGEYLRTFRRKWLLKNRPTPFARILQLRAWGRRIRNCTTSIGIIRWADDGNSLHCKNLYLEIPAFQRFLRDQLDSMAQVIQALCLLGKDQVHQLPSIDLARLEDNPAETKPGWSFLKEPKNELQQYTKWLLHRVTGEKELDHRFLKPYDATRFPDPNNPPQRAWKADEVKEYLKRHQLFLMRFALLTQILSGQPARGTELFSLRFQNTLEGGPRNVYIEEGMVTFITTYSKGYHIKGDLNIINRFLPQELGLYFVQYLAFIRPFVQQIHQVVYNNLYNDSHIWVNGNTAQLSTFFARQTLQNLGDSSRITVQSWRHLAIAISRQFLPTGEYFHNDKEQQSQRDLDGQAIHDSLTAAAEYARLTHEAPGQIRPFRERYRKISQLWHYFWLERDAFPPRIDKRRGSNSQQSSPRESSARYSSPGPNPSSVRSQEQDNEANVAPGGSDGGAPGTNPDNTTIGQNDTLNTSSVTEPGLDDDLFLGTNDVDDAALGTGRPRLQPSFHQPSADVPQSAAAPPAGAPQPAVVVAPSQQPAQPVAPIPLGQPQFQIPSQKLPPDTNSSSFQEFLAFQAQNFQHFLQYQQYRNAIYPHNAGNPIPPSNPP